MNIVERKIKYIRVWVLKILNVNTLIPFRIFTIQQLYIWEQRKSNQQHFNWERRSNVKVRERTLY